MTIRVVRPGLLTTIQDLGRPGHQHDGIPAGGAMDTHAVRLANLLVGNDEGAAVLEMTLAGPQLTFGQATTIAVTGADFEVRLGGAPMSLWRSISVTAGSALDAGSARTGCRGYLAITGGFDVPSILGSRSTYLPAAFGGHEGRSLRAGDVISSGNSPGPVRHLPGRTIAVAMRPSYGTSLRLIRDDADGPAGHAAQATLFEREFVVSARSDRMGYRLEGPDIGWHGATDVLSAAVTMGTLQLPPGGSPILLMADRQTTGGYPVLGQVATVDLGSAAQLRPGDRVRFTELSLDEAQRLYLNRERATDALRRALLHPL